MVKARSRLLTISSVSLYGPFVSNLKYSITFLEIEKSNDKFWCSSEVRKRKSYNLQNEATVGAIDWLLSDQAMNCWEIVMSFSTESPWVYSLSLLSQSWLKIILLVRISIAKFNQCQSWLNRINFNQHNTKTIDLGINVSWIKLILLSHDWYFLVMNPGYCVKKVVKNKWINTGVSQGALPKNHRFTGIPWTKLQGEMMRRIDIWTHKYVIWSRVAHTICLLFAITSHNCLLLCNSTIIFYYVIILSFPIFPRYRQMYILHIE